MLRVAIETMAATTISQRNPSPRGRGQGPNPKLPKWLVWLAWLSATGALLVGGGIAAGLAYYSTQLPDFRSLEDYKPQLISKVYDRNGQIIAEYANERRIWVPIAEIPKPLIQSFLAAEDANFYEHGGYDLKAIVRAMLFNVLTHRTQGASTITQQVAKTYLLSAERTYTRKIKELILSWRIEQAFSKNEILELYLNRIYLGNGSYGVAAAAQTYFSKSLDELTWPERAMLAGMPQAPSRYNPIRNPQAALARRNVILGRIAEEQFITKNEAASFQQTALGLKPNPLRQGEDAPHFAEFIRRQIVGQYGEKALLEDGLNIYTTVDLPLQRIAEAAVQAGLRAYDRRHGWRGALTKLPEMADWETQLDTLAEEMPHVWRFGRLAVVRSVKAEQAKLGLIGGTTGMLKLDGAKWTGRRNLAEMMKVGDVLVVSQTTGSGPWQLEQIPVVQGALVALDVPTGAVLAMVGGLGEGSGYNRAVQAKRQVGSSFKPFVYAAALENGYTPASTVLDQPLVFGSGDTEWKPHNYDNTVGGPTTLREGLEKSRNLMTVRLAQEVGLRNVASLAARLGITDRVPIVDLSVALGTLDLNLLEMTSAYSVFARGGQQVKPSYIRRIQDAEGTTLYRANPACETCLSQLGATPDTLPTPPNATGQNAISPQVAYQMTSMLQGVVQRGTAARLARLGVPLAGKTGTTNDYVDAWFVGFTPMLATGVWVGFDTPKSLGVGETGARAAIPVWEDFMADALKTQPTHDFPIPGGLEFVQIDAATGYLPGVNTMRTMNEAFVPGTAPSTTTPDLVDDPTFFGGLFGDADEPSGQGPEQGLEQRQAPRNQEGGQPGVMDKLLRTFGIF